MRYPLIIEKTDDSYGAYAPDVPGCGVVGDSIEEVKESLVKALHMHFEGLAEERRPIPMPGSTTMDEINVDVPEHAVG